MKCSLNEILKYEHPAVVRRFQKEFKVAPENAQIIFKDLLRFFWASEKHFGDLQANPQKEEYQFVYIMDEAMKSIDQMWHIFLLYTKDYMDFCEQYFGEYIHHLPDIVPTMEQDEVKFEINLNRFLSYNYDLLGEKIICRWFNEKEEVV